MSEPSATLPHSLDTPTILVPIRYPLTDPSMRTLARAVEIASEYDAAELVVLHVNLFHVGDQTRPAELSRAIAPFVGEIPTTISICEGFLVEEIILDEVDRLGATIVVLGVNQKPRWRRALSQLLGNDPDIASFLEDQADVRIAMPAGA